MSSITTPAVTPDDLLTLPDAVRYELVDGRLLERQMGTESSEIAVRIIGLLLAFLRDHRLGRLFGSDASYRCFANAPGKVRRADVGFVRFDRLPGGRAPKGHCLVSPDLAVEVISPNDTSEEVEEKVLEWIDAGVRLVWVVSPGSQTVRIHRPRSAPGGPVSMLAGDGIISGEDVLPGFSAAIGEFFNDL